MTPPCGQHSRAHRRACSSRGIRWRNARCGVPTDEVRGTAGRLRPPAGSCSRERATASFSRWMPGPGRPCGPRTIRPRHLPVRSATRSAASSTSPCWQGMAARSFSSRAFVAASEGHALNGRVYVFKLGGTAPRPALNLQKTPLAKPPVIAVSADAYNRGGRALRRQLHVLPRRSSRDRRRPSGPSAVGTAP